MTQQQQPEDVFLSDQMDPYPDDLNGFNMHGTVVIDDYEVLNLLPHSSGEATRNSNDAHYSLRGRNSSGETISHETEASTPITPSTTTACTSSSTTTTPSTDDSSTSNGSSNNNSVVSNSSNNISGGVLGWKGIIPSCGISCLFLLDHLIQDDRLLKDNVVILLTSMYCNIGSSTSFSSSGSSTDMTNTPISVNLTSLRIALERIIANDAFAVVILSDVDNVLAATEESSDGAADRGSTPEAFFGQYKSFNADCFPIDFRKSLGIPVVINTGQCPLSLFEASGMRYCCITSMPLKRADHIFREIGSKGVMKLMSHHGIYMGHGRVLHFSGNENSSGKSGSLSLILNRKAARIRSISIMDFMKHGDVLGVKDYEECDDADTVVERAEEAFVNQGFPGYDIVSNNCEHFACWCKTGKGSSSQVKATLGLGLSAAFVLGTGLLLAQRRSL